MVQEGLLKYHPKCRVLTVGKFENIRHTRYSIYGNELDHVFEEKDLGTMMDSALSFEEHISLKVKRGNAILGVIRRSFSFASGNLCKRLYVISVRPNLEHAQVVWAPHLMKYINVIENVQIPATKLVDGSRIFWQTRPPHLSVLKNTWRYDWDVHTFP